MEIRFYTKAELAHEVLPHISVTSAENRLMIWIKRNPDLMAALERTGYSKYQKYFTASQVRLIAEALVL